MLDKINQRHESTQYEQFLKLVRQNEKKIFGYVLSLVPKFSIAEDIMQNVILVMWKKFADYREDSSFSAWGMSIGRFVVLDYYRKENRSIVHFSSDAVERITRTMSVYETYDDRLDVLHSCIKKLPHDLRLILRLRYQQKHSIKEVADKIKKPVHSMYKLISKIHNILRQCIETNLSLQRDDV